MKKVIQYIGVILALLMVSCEISPVDKNSNTEIFLPQAGYITFSSNVITKAPIITDLEQKNFGLLGYSFSNTTTWEFTRSTALPDIFYNQLVTCDEFGIPTYDIDNTKSGIQLHPWNILKWYSFFAYYPYITSENNTLLELTSQDLNDMPNITYRLPFSDNPVNPDRLLDLMTAGKIDHNPLSSNGSMVKLDFEHRLFCLELVSKNFNDSGNEIIKNPKITIDNLAYSGITVPLLKSINEPVAPIIRTQSKITFDLTGGAGSDEGVIVYAKNDPNYKAEVLVSGTKPLMLVPQDASQTPLTGNVEFIDGDGKTQKTNFSANINFKEGRKYTLSVNFTGDAIVLVLSEARAWEEHSVPYYFE